MRTCVLIKRRLVRIKGSFLRANFTLFRSRAFGRITWSSGLSGVRIEPIDCTPIHMDRYPRGGVWFVPLFTCTKYTAIVLSSVEGIALYFPRHVNLFRPQSVLTLK